MKASLRPFLPADAPVLADIFRESIELLTQDDYDENQRAAWASVADDEEDFAARLAGALTIVAVVEGEAVGFVSLRGADELDMLYVHPDCAGHGIGALLADAIEKLAGARGAKALTTHSSDTARPFFERRSYVAQSRNTVMVGGEWLANTTLRKPLAASPSTGSGTP